MLETILPRRLKLVYLALLIVPFLLFLRPVTQANFMITDDHEIIRFETQNLNLSKALAFDKNSMGRFRPVYWISRLIQYRIFKADPLNWHLFNFFLAISTAALIYSVTQLLKFHPLLSVYAAWFCTLNLSAVNAWSLTGPQETQATLFLLIAILFMFTSTKKAWIFDTLSILFIILTVLTKENYALFIPSLIILKIFI